MGGWTGKLLRVDLTTGRHRVEDVPGDWLRDYIGGRGVADRYLWEELDPRVDPFSPDNKLIFATGPLTGTPRVPRMATALRFLEPMTAPTPDRPAARCLSFMMQANRTRFSPAGPMQATRALGTPSSARMPSSVADTVLPQKARASRSCTSSSEIQR